MTTEDLSPNSAISGQEPQRPKRRRRKTFAHYRRQERKLAKRVRVARKAFDDASTLERRIVAALGLWPAVEDYLRSFAARLVASHEAVKDLGRDEVKRSPYDIAKDVDVFSSCNEPVTVFFKKKSNDELRLCINPGPVRRAGQILTRNAISEQLGERPWDQKLFNGGTKAAVEQIKANYEDGYKFACHLDVVDCYSSFNVEKVALMLFLPEEVANNVLTGQSIVTEHSSTTTEEDVSFNSKDARIKRAMEKARRGLSTGSKVSPLIADFMLTWVHIALTDCGDVRVTSFADNFVVQTRDRVSLRNAAQSLCDALHSHPAGPLRENRVETELLPYDAFEFLGYRLEPDGTRLTATMSDENLEKARELRAECYLDLRRATTEDDMVEFVLQLERIHRQLVNAFPAWSGRNRYHALKMRKVRDFATKMVERLAARKAKGI